MKFASSIYSIVQQLGHDAVSRLRRELETAYSIVHVLCPMALARVFGVAATSIHWKAEECKDQKGSEPGEGHPAEDQRALQRRHAFEGLEKDALLNVCVSLNISDFLIRCKVPFVLSNWSPKLLSFVRLQCKVRFGSNGAASVVHD